jgi:hypothetical protein
MRCVYGQDLEQRGFVALASSWRTRTPEPGQVQLEIGDWRLETLKTLETLRKWSDHRPGVKSSFRTEFQFEDEVITQ